MNKGYTYIEALIVLFIVFVVVSLLAPRINNAINKSLGIGEQYAAFESIIETLEE